MIVFGAARLDADLGHWIMREDRSYAERFGVERRRLQSLVARALARRLLAEIGPASPSWTIASDAQGRPRACSGDIGIHLSLSHSGSWVAAAAADRHLVGIDVEQRRPGRDWIALAQAFSDGERRRVADEGAAAFYEIWTRREAMAKARGEGFAAVVDSRDPMMTHQGDMLIRSIDLATHTLTVVALGAAPDQTEWVDESSERVRIWRHSPEGAVMSTASSPRD